MRIFVLVWLLTGAYLLWRELEALLCADAPLSQAPPPPTERSRAALGLALLGLLIPPASFAETSAQWVLGLGSAPGSSGRADWIELRAELHESAMREAEELAEASGSANAASESDQDSADQALPIGARPEDAPIIGLP